MEYSNKVCENIQDKQSDLELLNNQLSEKISYINDRLNLIKDILMKFKSYPNDSDKCINDSKPSEDNLYNKFTNKLDRLDIMKNKVDSIYDHLKTII